MGEAENCQYIILIAGSGLHDLSFWPMQPSDKSPLLENWCIRANIFIAGGLGDREMFRYDPFLELGNQLLLSCSSIKKSWHLFSY